MATVIAFRTKSRQQPPLGPSKPVSGCTLFFSLGKTCLTAHLAAPRRHRLTQQSKARS